MNDEMCFNVEMIAFIDDLMSKADVVNSKTAEYANVHVDVDGISVPLRVDDHQLLFICARLMPNILNYLVNILPQFAYPYVVSYLRNLSDFRDDPVTINELYNYICDGNIQHDSETEG